MLSCDSILKPVSPRCWKQADSRFAPILKAILVQNGLPAHYRIRAATGAFVFSIYEPGFLVVNEQSVSAWSCNHLAFVIAHELAHSILGHASNLQEVWGKARAVGCGAEQAIRLESLVSYQQEYAADAMGFLWAKQAGFAPSLAEISNCYAKHLPVALVRSASHPSWSDRVGRLMQRFGTT